MKIVTMSFDDGTVQDRRLVGLLEAAGMRATFNINSGFFGQEHEIVHDGIRCDHSELSQKEAGILYRGQEVNVHTVHHPNLADCTEEEILYEVGEDHRVLEAVFGQKIIGMAYPGGGTPYNAFVMEVIKAHTEIRFARTIHAHHRFSLPENWMEWDPTCDIQDAQLFSLTEQFISAPDTDEIQLLFVWGHSFEFDKYDNWERAEQWIRTIADCPDLHVMTCQEVYHLLEKE